jgi:hypothetical protein
MPYVANGYGTKNKSKGLYPKSNDQHHGPNRANRSCNRVDERKKPYVFRPAPEPDTFDCRVHNEIQMVFGPRGKSILKTPTVQNSNHKKAAKKVTFTKNPDENIDFDDILSEMEIMNRINQGFAFGSRTSLFVHG